jgi:hypothetical protein
MMTVTETTGQELHIGDFVTIVKAPLPWIGRQGYVREILYNCDYVFVDIDDSPRDRRPVSAGFDCFQLRKEAI